MRLTLKEKIYGFLYGGAIGDALGLGTEFMSAPEAEYRYPEGLSSYSQIIRDAHRSQWNNGEWTNDTEIIIAMIETLIAEGKVNPQSFAKALYEWFLSNPVDVVPQVRWVISQPDYLDRPFEVAERIWVNMGRQHASNESLQRSILCGIWEERPTTSLVSDVCRITHPDTRCIGASSVIAAVANALLREERIPSEDDLICIANEIDTRVVPYIKKARTPDLKSLELDDPETLWYVRKCMSCALWALYHTSSPQEALETIVMAGGDADTNCAVALSLLGLRDGFSSLPTHLIEGLVWKDKLSDVASRFYTTLTEHLSSLC